MIHTWGGLGLSRKGLKVDDRGCGWLRMFEELGEVAHVPRTKRKSHFYVYVQKLKWLP